jgi:hypothetical protein
LIDINHLMHYITLLLAHSCAFAIDHAELEFEEPTEQAQADDLTNLVWIKACPSALNQYSLSFILNLALCSIMIVY